MGVVVGGCSWPKMARTSMELMLSFWWCLDLRQEESRKGEGMRAGIGSDSSSSMSERSKGEAERRVRWSGGGETRRADEKGWRAGRVEAGGGGDDAGPSARGAGDADDRVAVGGGDRVLAGSARDGREEEELLVDGDAGGARHGGQRQRRWPCRRRVGRGGDVGGGHREGLEEHALGRAHGRRRRRRRR
jgi:hypothetical protein